MCDAIWIRTDLTYMNDVFKGNEKLHNISLEYIRIIYSFY